MTCPSAAPRRRVRPRKLAIWSRRTASERCSLLTEISSTSSSPASLSGDGRESAVVVGDALWRGERVVPALSELHDLGDLTGPLIDVLDVGVDHFRAVVAHDPRAQVGFVGHDLHGRHRPFGVDPGLLLAARRLAQLEGEVFGCVRVADRSAQMRSASQASHNQLHSAYTKWASPAAASLPPSSCPKAQ